MEALAEAMSVLDRAAKVGAIHPNAAARRKSRLARKVAAALGGTTVQTARVAKSTGTAAAQKAAKARVAASKATKAKGPQTAAGKARAALTKTARDRGAAAPTARRPRPSRPRPRPPRSLLARGARRAAKATAKPAAKPAAQARGQARREAGGQGDLEGDREEHGDDGRRAEVGHDLPLEGREELLARPPFRRPPWLRRPRRTRIVTSSTTTYPSGSRPRQTG